MAEICLVHVHMCTINICVYKTKKNIKAYQDENILGKRQEKLKKGVFDPLGDIIV